MKRLKLIKLILLCLAGSIFFKSQPSFATGADAYISFNTSKKYLAHINRGYIAMDTRNYPLALKEFMTAKYINDELFAAYDGLGRIYELTRNNGQALQAYQKALDLVSPKYAQDLIAGIYKARQNQETRNALGLYKIVLSIRPEAGLQVLYGDKYHQEGNLERALVYYKRAYSLQENPQEYLKYIQLKYPNKEYERYIIRKYIQKSLRYPEAHFKAGLIYLQNKHYNRASDEFSIAVSQISVPSFENKYMSYLGQTYYREASSVSSPKMEGFDKAIDLFEKYLARDPKNSDTQFKLADAYFYKDMAKMKSYDSEIDKLEKRYGKVTDLNPNTPNYSEKKSEFTTILNKKYNPALFDKTIEILQRIQDINNFDPGLYYSLGNVYSKKAMLYHKGYYDREKYMNTAKVSARDRAWAYYLKALNEYKSYIKKSPKNNGMVYYDIGTLFYQASKLEPNRSRLPVTPENRKEYQRWGAKFYRRDMLTRSTANFKTYLNYHPRGNNVAAVNNLIREMQLGMLVNW